MNSCTTIAAVANNLPCLWRNDIVIYVVPRSRRVAQTLIFVCHFS